MGVWGRGWEGCSGGVNPLSNDGSSPSFDEVECKRIQRVRTCRSPSSLHPHKYWVLSNVCHAHWRGQKT